MNRRTFLRGLTLGTLAAPLVGEAQPAQKMWRIGWLGDGSRTARESNTLSPLRDGLRELGYVEGKNLVINARWSEGADQQLARDAAEFVRLNVDVIVTHGSPAGLVAKQATQRSRLSSRPPRILSVRAWWPACPGRVAT